MQMMIIYDSQTGNTEKMANAIADGARLVDGIDVDVKRIGDPFPVSEVSNSDGILFGSPCIYGNVTEEMKNFIERFNTHLRRERVNIKGRTAAIFGSYGWDGAYCMEELFKEMIHKLGYRMKDEVCVEIDTNIKYHDDYIERCKNFGKEFAKSLAHS